MLTVARPRRQWRIRPRELTPHATNPKAFSVWEEEQGVFRWTIIYELTVGVSQTWTVHKNGTLLQSSTVAMNATRSAASNPVTVVAGDRMDARHTGGDATGSRCRIVFVEDG